MCHPSPEAEGVRPKVKTFELKREPLEIFMVLGKMEFCINFRANVLSDFIIRTDLVSKETDFLSQNSAAFIVHRYKSVNNLKFGK